MPYNIKWISELGNNLKKLCKKVCGKSCVNEKSAYLCNRFREGEPLKMTDWQSWGYGRECWSLHRVSYLADVQGSEKGQAARLLKTFQKFFFEKKTSKKFGGYEKTPYLCKRFPAETGARKKRQFFERLWINRLGCSTRSSPVYNK